MKLSRGPAFDRAGELGSLTESTAFELQFERANNVSVFEARAGRLLWVKGFQPLLGSGKPEDSPLYDPLAAIGFDRPAIVRLLNAYKPRLPQTWADITLAAVEKGRIEQSPQAFFTYYIKRAAKKEATPPDWWLEYERQQRRAEDEQ